MTTAKNNKKVLVVDDEEMLVDMIKLRLEGQNFDVVTAHDGHDGLAMAQKERPDLIILDINMKRTDGYTMLREVRECDDIKDTKVVMLTDSGLNRDLFEDAGISDFITKPFDSEDFMSRIHKVFNPNGLLEANIISKKTKPVRVQKVKKITKAPKTKKTKPVKKAKAVKKIAKRTKAAKGKKSK